MTAPDHPGQPEPAEPTGPTHPAEPTRSTRPTGSTRTAGQTRFAGNAGRVSAALVGALRAGGILRRPVQRPVVGPKAYVRLWQRLRSLIVLGAVVAGLGVALAAVVGVIVVGLAFFFENAIS